MIFAVILAVLVFAGTGYATASKPEEEWNLTYEVSGITSVDCLQQTADSGYIIAGNTRSNAFVLKTGPAGSEQWNQTLGGTGEEDVEFVRQTDDGGYVLIGNTDSHRAGSSDIWFVKIDMNGNLQWNKTFGGIHDDWAESIQQTHDGGPLQTPDVPGLGSVAACSSLLVCVCTIGIGKRSMK